MKRGMKQMIMLATWLMVCQRVLAQQSHLDVVRPLLAYDQKAPLDIKETGTVDRNGVKVQDINFASPKGGRITAYLIVPSTKGSHAGVVYGHWGNGNRTEFLSEAIALARVGTVSVLIDYPWERTGEWWQPQFGFNEPEKRTEQYLQAITDLQRAIDLLLARSDVDPNRIAYVGHSYGAQWGAVLAALDKRIKTAVLMAGVPSAASIWLEATNDASLVGFRKNLPQGVLEKFVEVYNKLDAVKFVPHAAPVSLLFQFGYQERYIHDHHMRQYAEAASQPKQVKWYDAGHDLLSMEALLDRENWLRKELDLRPVKPGAKKP
jgi:dienelactone hydrolase